MISVYCIEISWSILERDMKVIWSLHHMWFKVQKVDRLLYLCNKELFMMRKNCTVLATNSITAYGLRSGHCQWNESIKNFVRELFYLYQGKIVEH